MNRRIVFVVVHLLALVAPMLALAHDLDVARITLIPSATGYMLEAKLPLGFRPSPPVVPARFQVSAVPRLRQSDRYQVVRYELRSEAEHVFSDDDVLLLPWDREGAFVTATLADGTSIGRFVERTSRGIEVPMSLFHESRRALPDTARHYFVFGIEHLLLGWDHLAFVLCLCLIARGWRLAKLVTAFTLGHSLTLGAAALGIARLPVPPIEACIALSIAFVAREALVVGDHSAHGWRLAFAFGLLHGLGFASALSENGVHPSEVLPGLISFNVGIEVGQLLFVGAIAVLARISQHWPHGTGLVRPVLARALGVLALVWTFGRIVGFSV